MRGIPATGTVTGAVASAQTESREVLPSRCATADAERRRIGDDLHDGVQPQLLLVGQAIDRARRAEDPAEAHALLDQARVGLSNATADLRRLAHGLRPALLGMGLASALAELRARSPLPLEVWDLPDPPLPTALEEAAWFVVSEAVANAARHADASRVVISMRTRERVLVVEVTDDGGGGARPGSGSGLRGMHERARALGGRLEVHSSAGGTSVRMTVPL